MIEKTLLLVCEGETDLYIFQALSVHFSNSDIQLTLKSLAPQQDATSGTYSSHGFGNVLNWCTANRTKIQMLIDFGGASALFIQLDTDIAEQANFDCINQGDSARQCCEEKISQKLHTVEEPPRCHYILPTQNTETWILASHEPPQLDDNSLEINNYELINDTEQRLISLGYKSKKGKNKKAVRKLNKRPAIQYKNHGQQLIGNLMNARLRCSELDRLCGLFEGMNN